MTERAGLMPDDVEWLEKQLVRMEKKLDALPCMEHAEKLATYMQRVDDGIAAKKIGRSRGMVILTAVVAFSAFLSLILSIIVLLS